MSVKIGSEEAQNFKWGAEQVNKLYLGADLVWQRGHCASVAAAK